MSMTKRVLILASLLSVFTVTNPGLLVESQETFFSDSFEDPALPGWEHSPGVIARDGVMVIPPGNFSAYLDNFGDMNLTARVKRLGIGEFVLGFRLKGGNAYLVVFGPNFILFQREVEAELVEIASEFTPFPSDEWVEIKVELLGGELRVEINGEMFLAASDDRSMPPGGISFESLGELTLEIDDVSITQVGEEPIVEEEPQEVPKPEREPAPEPMLADSEFTWLRTGGPIGGLGYDVRMHPDNPDIMFVTDAFAGVFKSMDGGANWFPSNNGITARGGASGDAIPIFCLTIDPNDPNIVWTGTQNTRGIYKSVDGGQTWEERISGIVESEGITFRGITIDPHSSDIIYAAAEISSWAWSSRDQPGREFDKTKGVVYKSTNSGGSWSPIWRGDNLARYIIIDPRDSNVIYVSTGIFDREAANSDHTTNTPGGVGVIKSMNGGKTWTQMNNGITNLYVGTLFMHPSNPDILLAGSSNNAYVEGSGVFLTRNGGAYWEKVLDNGSQSVEFSVSNPNIAYSGDPAWIFRSDDGGENWVRTSGSDPEWGPPGVVAGFPIDFQVDPRNPDRLFANNYGGGNFLSEDGGRSWIVASTGYTGAQARAIDISPVDPAQVYVSARSGFFATSDGGSSWKGMVLPEASGLEWNAVAVDPNDPAHILAANNWMARIIESRDGALGWNLTDGRLREMQGWRVIAFSPSDSRIVYAGSGAFFSAGGFDSNIPAKGIFVSRDGGSTWHEANDANSLDANVSDLAVDPTNPRRVFAAAPAIGLLVTDDGGENWVIHPGFSAQSRTQSVSIHPTQPEIIFVGMEFGGLYRSGDGGASWKHIAAGIPPEGTVKSIVFNPIDPTIVFASMMESGVYTSKDGGETWLVINTGLRTRAVNDLAISGDGLHLYAATEGEGVFRLDLNGQPPEAAVEVVIPVIGAGSNEDSKDTVEPEIIEQKPAEEQDAPGVDIGQSEDSETEGAEGEGEPEDAGTFPCLGGMMPLILFGLVGIPEFWKKDSKE